MKTSIEAKQLAVDHLQLAERAAMSVFKGHYPSDLDDYIGEAYLALWEAILDYQGDADNFRPSVFTRVRCRVINKLRNSSRKKRGGGQEGLEWTDEINEEGDYEEHIIQRYATAETLSKLPDELRRMVQLRVLDNLVDADAAHEMGLPLTTFRGRWYTSRPRLQRVFGEVLR